MVLPKGELLMSKSQKIQSQQFSRRDVLSTAGLAAGVLAAGPAVSGADAAPSLSKGMPLTIAGYRFNRLAALVDGKVPVEGCDASFELSKISDMNTDVFSGSQTRDVTEIGLHPFMLAYANQKFRDYTLLPIFPLRLFRHKSIFIRTDRGIRTPEDLRGKTIGTSGYSSSSLTWIRGILQDEYGIGPEDVQWVISAGDSGLDKQGAVSKQELVLPEGLKTEVGPAGKDESDLLESGEVDVLFHAAEPRAYSQGDPQVARLFPDYRTTEKAYYAKTAIFPIMHAVAVRSSLLEENPWLAEAVFNAYSKSKQMDYEFMSKLGWIFDSLPWYSQELEETQKLMGDNFYSYGMSANRNTLETLFRYSYEQGLSSRELTIEELFAPESMEFEESV
jgi:4,5-dihydroxyphthalate decarboxylase